MATETLIVKGHAMPLDLLLWKRFGREVPGLVEATYDTNYGLADLGPMLPIGTEVAVIPPGPSSTATARKVVRLFE